MVDFPCCLLRLRALPHVMFPLPDSRGRKLLGGFYQTLSLPSKLKVGEVIISDSDLLLTLDGCVWVQARLALLSFPSRVSGREQWEAATVDSEP